MCVFMHKSNNFFCLVFLYSTHPLGSRLFRSLLCLLCEVRRPERQGQEDLTGPQRQIRTVAQ